MKKLVILVPDKNTQHVLLGLLPRFHKQLEILSKDYDIFIHPNRDPGIYHDAATFLRSFINQYQYALIFMDKEGSGQENSETEDIYRNIKHNLEINGWQNRAEVIILEPELEIWAWVDSLHLAKNFGWANFNDLKKFIIEAGFWQQNNPKPNRPKEAVEIALRKKRIQRSSAIYKKIAESVSFSNCSDASFLKLTQILFSWFARTNL